MVTCISFTLGKSKATVLIFFKGFIFIVIADVVIILVKKTDSWHRVLDCVSVIIDQEHCDYLAVYKYTWNETTQLAGHKDPWQTNVTLICITNSWVDVFRSDDPFVSQYGQTPFITKINCWISIVEF